VGEVFAAHYELGIERERIFSEREPRLELARALELLDRFLPATARGRSRSRRRRARRRGRASVARRQCPSIVVARDATLCYSFPCLSLSG
jgi:hypothetical protein